MATAKKTTAKKTTAKKTAKKTASGRAPTLQLADLRAATLASVNAVLGRQPGGRPGILVGRWLSDATLTQLGRTPEVLARDVARQAGRASGMRLTAVTERVDGGVLVGFFPPAVRVR